MNGTEPTWVTAEQPPVPEPSPPNGERVSNPSGAIKEEDGKTAAALWHNLYCFLFPLHLEPEGILVKTGTTRGSKQLALFLVD